MKKASYLNYPFISFLFLQCIALWTLLTVKLIFMDEFSFKSEKGCSLLQAAGVFLIFNRSPSQVQVGKLLLIKEVLLGSSRIIE